MATDALATPSGLKSNQTKDVATALNGVLADSYALYLKTKNFHWHLSGPHFRDYHQMFDEQATEILATTDPIAERVRKLGKTTLHSIGDISRSQTIADNDEDFVSATDMLKELRYNNFALVERLRELKELADEAKDNATSAKVDEWTDAAEQHAWFLFESAQKG